MHTHIPPDLAATVEAIAKSLAPNVVRIRYTIREDWSGEPSIFFRVVLLDEAAQYNRLRESARSVENALKSVLDFDAMDLYAYFNFRSEGERVTQPGLSDWKEWE